MGTDKNIKLHIVTDIKMASSDYLTFAFALVVVLGGLIGFLKKGSAPSLVAGIVFGGIIAFGATQTSHNPKNIWVVVGLCPSDSWSISLVEKRQQHLIHNLLPPY